MSSMSCTEGILGSWIIPSLNLYLLQLSEGTFGCDVLLWVDVAGDEGGLQVVQGGVGLATDLTSPEREKEEGEDLPAHPRSWAPHSAVSLLLAHSFRVLWTCCRHRCLSRYWSQAEYCGLRTGRQSGSAAPCATLNTIPAAGPQSCSLEIPWPGSQIIGAPRVCVGVFWQGFNIQ